MKRIQQLPATSPFRLATGPARAAGDWPGVFIRGDDSIGYAGHIRTVLNFTKRNSTKRSSVLEISAKECSALVELQRLHKLLNTANLAKRNSRNTMGILRR